MLESSNLFKLAFSERFEGALTTKECAPKSIIQSAALNVACLERAASLRSRLSSQYGDDGKFAIIDAKFLANSTKKYIINDIGERLFF